MGSKKGLQILWQIHWSYNDVLLLMRSELMKSSSNLCSGLHHKISIEAGTNYGQC